MGFPSIAGSAESHHSSVVGNHVIALPASIGAGDLLVAVMASGHGDSVSTWPAGWISLWSTFLNVSTGHKLEGRCRIADGSEGSSITVVTDNAVLSGHVCFRIIDHGAIECATAASGASGNADPPTLAPSWGAADTLWIAVGSALTGTNIFTGFPSGYGLGQHASNGNNVQMGTAALQFNGASEDPAVFTNPSAPWIAQTLAVAPLGLETTLERYLRGDVTSAQARERFLRGSILPSYPENFIRGDLAPGAATREIYLRGDTLAQALAENFLRGDALAQRVVETYLRGDVSFALYGGERFIRGMVSLSRGDGSFIRGDLEIAYHATFIRGSVTPVRAPNLGDAGDTPASPTTPGIMSRQYLSVAAVKKEIT